MAFSGRKYDIAGLAYACRTCPNVTKLAWRSLTHCLVESSRSVARSHSEEQQPMSIVAVLRHLSLNLFDETQNGLLGGSVVLALRHAELRGEHDLRPEVRLTRSTARESVCCCFVSGQGVSSSARGAAGFLEDQERA